MTKTFLTYTIICDRCGKDHNIDSPVSGWDDKDYALECAKDDDWIEHGHDHYCPDCYYYDDNDEIAISAPIEKH